MRQVSDLIDRQQAIDAVVSAMIDGADAELVEGVMELLPSAQPQRKKGKWIVQDIYQKDMYRVSCSCCGESSMVDQRSIAKAVGIKVYNYCPNCGAEMV